MLPDLIRQEWDYHRNRPFGRLVQVFVERIFRGGGDADTEGLDLGIGLVLTLLAMPGGFVSLLLFDKYGSLLQWLRGQHNVDTLLLTFPDEYFFIVLSMTVTGAIAVWRWDSIFPDRRDYMNLAYLPISTRTIFSANLMAVLYLVALVAVDVNAASCVLFPMVVSWSQGTLWFFVKFAAIHAGAVLIASVFSFLAVFSMLGLLMAIFPSRVFQRISIYVRGVVVVYLVTLLCTSFAVTESLRTAAERVPTWMFFFPSSWFVSLCQLLRGRANPAMVELAQLCVPGLFALAAIAFCAYALGYQRHFVRIAEIADDVAITHVPQPWRLRFFERLTLRSPFQKGGSYFACRTLFRSEAHRLMLTGVSGLALVLASEALMNAFQGTKSAREAALTPDALSIPFIVTFLLIIGLRVVFEVPAELRANWIFQLMLDCDRQECEPLARKTILFLVLPATLAVVFAVYVYVAGPLIAVLHALLVSAWTVLLTNLLLIRFRKIPFTCSLPVFKQHSIVILISFVFGYLIYALSTPEFESSALLDPKRMLELLPLAAVAWYIPRYFARNTIEIERRMIFEETGTRTVEVLRLSE